MTPKSIAVVVCSTRPGRINPFVARYVMDHIKKSPMAGHVASIELLDVASQNLPLSDESAIPGNLPADDPTPHYASAHTRAWSAQVRKYDAFIFVTPQYNWSIPASLKNALDHLFHEWRGKPAAIVTYGHRGGTKADLHLRQILAGLRVGGVAEQAVALKIVVTDSPAGAETAMTELWQKESCSDQIEAMFGQLIQLLQ